MRLSLSYSLDSSDPKNVEIVKVLSGMTSKGRKLFVLSALHAAIHQKRNFSELMEKLDSLIDPSAIAESILSAPFSQEPPVPFEKVVNGKIPEDSLTLTETMDDLTKQAFE